MNLNQVCLEGIKVCVVNYLTKITIDTNFSTNLDFN